MRASFPSQVEGHIYKMMVENEMQLNIVEQRASELVGFIRNVLENDHFNLTFEQNQGDASPHTWNEREVLTHMIENIPSMRSFIDDLGLTLG